MLWKSSWLHDIKMSRVIIVRVEVHILMAAGGGVWWEAVHEPMCLYFKPLLRVFRMYAIVM